MKKCSRNKLLLIFVFAVVISSVIFQSVSAYIASGRNQYYGYFMNRYGIWNNSDPYDGYVLTKGLPSSVTDEANGKTKSERIALLISYLKNEYDNGATRNRVGAAFVVNTMLGRTGSEAHAFIDWGSRTLVKPTDWTELTARLKYASINWDIVYHQNNTINSYYQWTQGDNAFYYDARNMYVHAIRFTNADGSTYFLKHKCGNPLGSINAIDKVVWDISATTTIKGGSSSVNTTNNITAYPTQKITWTHSVRNNGPDMTGRPINYYYDQKKYIDGQASSATYGANEPLGTIDAYWGSGITHSKVTDPPYTVQASDINKWICRRTISGDTSNTNANPAYSNSVCVHVIPAPLDYELKPVVELNPNGTIEPGSSFEVQPSITNSGSTVSDSVNYSLIKTITNPSALGKTTSGSGTFAVGNETNVLGYIETDTDKQVGTQICFVLTVQPYKSGSAASTTSPMVCVTITKKPKVQVWGGDVKVGRSFHQGNFYSQANITTSITVKSSLSYGSWAEYALVSPGLISGTGSGSALYKGMLDANKCNYSHLSFSNSTSGSSCSNSTKIGLYSFKKATIPNVAARFPVVRGSTPTLPSTGAVSLKDKKGLYTSESDGTSINIGSSNIPVGSWVVINAPNSTVTISGDIKYDELPLITGISTIPQVVIIAKNININANVERIDAWLIANKTVTGSSDGTINTCTGLTPKDCDAKLVINGPVMANYLSLRRTAGSNAGTASGDPAEVLNLRADAYLWAYAKASGSGRVWTVYSTNVPPRL